MSAQQFCFPELVIGAMPFSFGNWFTPGDSNWEDWGNPFPRRGFWQDITYDLADGVEGNQGGTIRVTGAQINAAGRKIAAGEASLHEGICQRIKFAMDNPDNGDIDAIDADAVLQVAIYGDVIFG